MENNVVLKSNRFGIMLILNKDVSFEELEKEIKEKFKNSTKFFKDSRIAISFEGRELSEEEELKIINTIEENSSVKIVCLIDENEEREKKYKEKVEAAIAAQERVKAEIKEQEDQAAKEEHMEQEEETTGQYYRGTLRSGQTIESASSVIILGDVNPGAKVVSNGSIIVLGSLLGKVYAGAGGDNSCFVVALEMNPVQIRIGDYIAKNAEKSVFKIKMKKKKVQMESQIAYVEDGSIYVESLTKEVLNDMKKNI